MVFTVQDDGVGFAAQPDPSSKVGYGLATMRERADAIGGSFNASSEKGRGTLQMTGHEANSVGDGRRSTDPRTDPREQG